MDKLDRLGWAAGISFTSLGVRIGIRTNSKELLGRVVAQLPAGWACSPTSTVTQLYSVIEGGTSRRPNVRAFHVLYANLDRLERTTNLEQLLASLESDIDAHIARSTRVRFFVHAGAVAWKGKAIILPGRTLSGKSTLVKEFLRAGAEYLSDEYAVLDANGSVHPFPRPLSIRKGKPEDGDRTRVTAAELGAKSANLSLPVSFVILARYRFGARWRPKVLSPGKAVLGLMENSIAARSQPEKALATLKKTVQKAVVLEGTRGEAQEVVESILKNIENLNYAPRSRFSTKVAKVV